MRGMSGVHSKYGSQVWFTLSVIYFSFVRIHCLWITILFGPAVNYLGCACSCSLNCCLFELFALYVSPPPLSLDIRHVIALLKNKPNKNRSLGHRTPCCMLSSLRSGTDSQCMHSKQTRIPIGIDQQFCASGRNSHKIGVLMLCFRILATPYTYCYVQCACMFWRTACWKHLTCVHQKLDSENASIQLHYRIARTVKRILVLPAESRPSIIIRNSFSANFAKIFPIFVEYTFLLRLLQSSEVFASQ